MTDRERRKNVRRVNGAWSDIASSCARRIIDEHPVDPAELQALGPSSEPEGCELFVSLVNVELDRLMGRLAS